MVARIRPEPGGAAPLDSCLALTGRRSVDLEEPAEAAAHPNGTPFAKHRPKKHTYTLDEVLGPSATQDDVYAHVAPLVASAANGYNATVFAYGHTGSGKTHTMTGERHAPGVTPRAVRDLFCAIATATGSGKVFLVHLSYVELHNNRFRNLLKSEKDAINDARIEIRECREFGVFLSGPPDLKRTVTSERDVRDLVAIGDRARAFASTNCNDHSSRSHCVLTLHVQSKDAAGAVRVGKLNLVDLAGSERVSVSGAAGDTLTESKSINLSLALLGDVLAALSRNAQREIAAASPRKGGAPPRDPEPVPYRNSKLTHLLKDSLGGNSKTLMITNLRAIPAYYRQSLVSLSYASRAKKIKNATSVNVDRGRGDRSSTSLRVVSEQLERLRSQFRDRELAFEALCATSATSSAENARLKVALQSLESANADANADLEARLSGVIHGV